MRPFIESMRAACGLAIVLALAACGDGGAAPDVPTPGLLTVALETPNAADAAVLFRITGPVDEVSAYDAGALLESHTFGSTTTVAVFGSLESGPIARVAVPDTRASYDVQLQQVAAGDNTLRADLEAYDLTIGD